MILIDDRGGAKSKKAEDYYPGQLQSMIPDSMLTRFDYGDVMFAGANGVTVGIELKKVPDALSCIFNSRLADTQLPGMAESYDVRYLIVEGLYRGDPDTGVLQRWKPFPSEKDVKCGKWFEAQAGRNRITYSTFELWLHTMSELGMARLERTADIEGTAALIQVLYAWWNRSDHKSFNVMYDDTGSGAPLSRPTRFRRILSQLPHVRWERSGILLPKIRAIQFVHKDGHVMHGEDWYIEGQIAEKSALDIDAACEGEDS